MIFGLLFDYFTSNLKKMSSLIKLFLKTGVSRMKQVQAAG